MFLLRASFLFLLSFVVITASSQKLKKADKAVVANLHRHIEYLADDKLEGRRAGTHGEELAMDYIIERFKEIGLSPKGPESFPQSFPINEGKQIASTTYFTINDSKLEAGRDYFPFAFSPGKKIEAAPAIAIQEADMPWFVDLADPLEENKNNPHFDLVDYIRTNSKKAADRGATAIILYNSSSIDDKLVFDGKDKTEQLSIPVIYVSKDASKKYFSDKFKDIFEANSEAIQRENLRQFRDISETRDSFRQT